MSVPKPANEKTRLNVLWQYGVLDTVPEAMFDDLTELASSICGAPIALISLVDERRQWFKSRIGLDMQESRRDTSFCAHAICQEDLFIVPNATRDARFRNNPMVKGPTHIRFYAGAPLITPDGYALGTLCVLDKKPRRLSSDQRRALRLLSRIVMTELERRRQARKQPKSESAGKWSSVTIRQRAARKTKRGRAATADGKPQSRRARKK